MNEQKTMMHCIVNNVTRNEVELQTQKSYKIGNTKYVMIILFRASNTNIREYISENEYELDKMSGENILVFPITDKKILSQNPQYDYSKLGSRIKGFKPKHGKIANIFDDDLLNSEFGDMPYVIIIDSKTKKSYKFKINIKLTKDEIGTKFGYMFDILKQEDFESAVILLSLKNIWKNCKEISLATITGLISILISLWKP